MDPQLLEKDELEVEFDIRAIARDDPTAVGSLGKIIEEETNNLRQKPIRVHPTCATVIGELMVLQWKLSTIPLKSSDIVQLSKDRSRLLHLWGRISRLMQHTEGDEQAIRLRDDIKSNLLKCTALLSTQMSRSFQNPAPAALGGDQLQSLALTDGLQVGGNSQGAEIGATGGQIEGPHVAAITSSGGGNHPHATDDVEVAKTGSAPGINSFVDASTQAGGDQPVQAQASANTHRIDQPSADVAVQPTGTLAAGTGTPFTLVGSFETRSVARSSEDRSDQGRSPSSNAAVFDTPFSVPIGRNANHQHSPLRPLIDPHDRVQNSANHVRSSDADRDHQAATADLGNPAQGWTMSRWPLRFGGTAQDMAVDEFLFRTETLARLANLSQAALTLGLHQLLTGAAAAWYWIFIRNEPDATWMQVRQSLSFAFQSNVSDAAIRRMIMDRLQRPGERFMDFCIAIQGLEVRLVNRMSDLELRETMKRNMLPHIQDRLLFVPINSTLELQHRVRQVEELVQRQTEVQHIRRSIAKVHELLDPSFASNASEKDSTPVPPQLCQGAALNRFVPVEPRSDASEYRMGNPTVDPYAQGASHRRCVDAVDQPLDQNQWAICWNCDDIGHTFMDCSAPRRIFCFGCGTKGVVRPQCARCNARMLPGNGRRNARPTFERRPSSQAFQNRK